MTQKYILRRACSGLLPPQALTVGKSFNRLKHDLELCDVLDAMADDLLAPAAVAARGFFEPGYIAALRKRPRGGAAYGRERIYRLWSVLLTELWSRLYLDRRAAALADKQARGRRAASPVPVSNSTITRTGTADG
jgi:hypothetical protein